MAYADGTTVSAAATDGDANNGSTSAPDLVQLLPNATLTEQQLVALVAPSAAEQLHVKNTATMLWFHCLVPDNETSCRVCHGLGVPQLLVTRSRIMFRPQHTRSSHSHLHTS